MRLLPNLFLFCNLLLNHEYLMVYLLHNLVPYLLSVLVLLLNEVTYSLLVPQQISMLLFHNTTDCLLLGFNRRLYFRQLVYDELQFV